MQRKFCHYWCQNEELGFKCAIEQHTFTCKCLISFEKLHYPISSHVLSGIIHKDDKKAWLDTVAKFTYISQQLSFGSRKLPFLILPSFAALMAVAIFLCFWRKVADPSSEVNHLTQGCEYILHFANHRLTALLFWVFLCSAWPPDWARADWQNLAKASSACSLISHGQTHFGKRCVQTTFMRVCY